MQNCPGAVRERQRVVQPDQRGRAFPDEIDELSIIAIDDPVRSSDDRLDVASKVFERTWRPVRPPEGLIELEMEVAEARAQPTGKERLPGAAVTDHDDALEIHARAPRERDYEVGVDRACARASFSGAQSAL